MYLFLTYVQHLNANSASPLADFSLTDFKRQEGGSHSILNEKKPNIDGIAEDMSNYYTPFKCKGKIMN